METPEEKPRYSTGIDADGDETITFKCKDLTTYGVQNEEGTEFLCTISGFGLSVAFNMARINSLGDAEAMANGIADVFHAALMDELIEMKKEFVKPPQAG